MRTSLYDVLSDPKRGIWLPDQVGGPWYKGPHLGDPWNGYDPFGRPQRLNIQTVADYYKNDIMAVDRLFLEETNRTKAPFPHQRIIMKAVAESDFVWIQMMRGGAKTYTTARFVLDYALQNANTPIILTGPSFRQALLAYDEVLKMVMENTDNDNATVKIQFELRGDPKRNQTESIIAFQNGSSIRALPMGDGRKIRGIRGGMLFIDEMYQMPEEMHSLHVMPFLQVMQGGMESKVVYATTSYYQDCFAYQRLMQFGSEVKAQNPDYRILDFNLADLIHMKFPLSKKIYKDALRNADPVQNLMTYWNIWPSSQSRWFAQEHIDYAISSQHTVRIEKKRESTGRYFAVIDLAASDKGDMTEILVFKFVSGKVHVVWAHAEKGLKPSERVWLAREVRRNFHPEFIIYDRHAAIGIDFKTGAEESQLLVKGMLHKVRPMVHHDNYAKVNGDRILVPIEVKDSIVRKALVGPRGGESIIGEGGLRELLFTKARELMIDGLILGPSAPESLLDDTGTLMQYTGSEQEVYDVIFEAFQQLGNIGIKKDKLGDVDRTDAGNVKFESRQGTHDDGAMCIVYSVVGLLRMLGRTGSRSHGGTPFGRPMGGSPEPEPIIYGANVTHQRLTI